MYIECLDKRSAVGVRQAIASQTVDGSNETFIWFDTNDELFLKESGEATYEKRTIRKFRDTSAWYHIVMAMGHNTIHSIK